MGKDPMISVRFDNFKGDLVKNLGNFDKNVYRAMVGACAFTAPKAEGWMRSTARWTDQTGNARNGLTARPQAVPKSAVYIARIVFAYSVDYGIWLEVRFGGRYAIIQPALRRFLPVALATTGKLLKTK